MLSTSILWSRRRTTANALNAPPKLTPLSLKNYGLTDIGPAIKSSQSCTTISSSSSILFTPTEMVGVLLGDNTTSRYFKQPLQSLSNSSSEPNIVECTQYATKRFHFDSSSVLACLQQRSEFDVEIDMATLATEVALNTLDSDDEGELDEEMEMIGLEVPKINMKSFRPRLRLLPYSPEIEEEVVLERQVQSDAVVKGETISISIHEEESNPPSSSVIEESQPVRKGRARMSQEKRRRLARRREREALMMGLPPRASSAPPSNTTFASVLEKGIGGSIPVKVKVVPESRQTKVNVKHCLPPRPLYHQTQPLHQTNNKSPREQHFLLPDQVFMNAANTQPYRCCISVNQ